MPLRRSADYARATAAALFQLLLRTLEFTFRRDKVHVASYAPAASCIDTEPRALPDEPARASHQSRQTFIMVHQHSRIP